MSQLRHNLQSLHPKRLLAIRNDRRIVQQFADRHHLVFFDHVDQHDEDQKLVHGLTASAHHHDQFYVIGTYQHYDVVFVERNDQLPVGSMTHTKAAHRWHIFQLDLKRSVEHPLTIITNHRYAASYESLLHTKHSQLRPAPMNALAEHDSAFRKHYHVTTTPTHFVYAEHLLQPAITSIIAKHFGHFAIEISGTSLLLYSERSTLSAGLLDAMLQNGAWLAKQIDARIGELQASLQRQ